MGGVAAYSTIRTLTLDVKVKFVPNDNRENDRALTFRIFAGRSELRAAWVQRTKDEPPRDYLRVQIDDHSLPESIWVAVFHAKGDEKAQLVWTRRRAES